MKKDFDFGDVGKRVPYGIPEGFFDEVQKNVMERTQKPVRYRTKVLRFTPAILAVAAVLAAIAFLPVREQETKVDNISQVADDNVSWIEDLSDEELEAMSDFSDCDIFMN